MPNPMLSCASLPLTFSTLQIPALAQQALRHVMQVLWCGRLKSVPSRCQHSYSFQPSNKTNAFRVAISIRDLEKVSFRP